VGRIPVASHAKIVTTRLVIQIVVKAAQLPILKSHPRETSSSRHRRSHQFYNYPDAPLFVTDVGDFVANPQKEPFTLVPGLGPLRAIASVLSRDGTDWNYRSGVFESLSFVFSCPTDVPGDRLCAFARQFTSLHEKILAQPQRRMAIFINSNLFRCPIRNELLYNHRNGVLESSGRVARAYPLF
jgi:hypothetical protein